MLRYKYSHTQQTKQLYDRNKKKNEYVKRPLLHYMIGCDGSASIVDIGNVESDN